MRIRVEGSSANKRPLLFIHGAGGAATVWLDVFRHFEKTRLVIAPDLPSHGQSDVWHAVEDRARIAHYRDAIGVAASHLEVDKAILVGHSMGGLVALSAAAAHPDKVAGVVLIGAASGMKPSPELLSALSARPTHQAEILAELGWSPATPRDTVSRWCRTVTGAEPEVTLADLRGVAAFDAEAILSSVRAPVLLLGGADDLLCPPALIEACRRALPTADAQIVTEAGHHPHLEQPSVTIQAIDRFSSFV